MFIYWIQVHKIKSEDISRVERFRYLILWRSHVQQAKLTFT